ncbi:MAG TPA: zinc ABC transporter substrate-binding protein [Fimbriimonadaceae bacterium]|nr:zinc ABC transporter substrate-binding protein [Fimbriimonadaceae bacterium]HRE92682.1 zinc ABC transporter substrate-binding protein [Fimbriimonadaceae bacterium]HRI73333.1 zinc ABC transporter substrate-binding protein [Fimbriimonadaceae bacterium]
MAPATPAAPGKTSRTAPIKAVTTVAMLEEIVRTVGGDRVEVQALMGPGVDPHLYRATARDTERLDQAELIVAVGLHLEGKLDDILARQTQRGKTVVMAGETIPESMRLKVEAGKDDPHIWHDPIRWQEVVDPIREALTKLDPAHADEFTSRAEDYIRAMNELDGEAELALKGIPEERRVLITAHDAFRYFGDRYKIEVRGIQGINTASEASARDIMELADFIVARKIRAIFVESSVPPATIEALQKAVRAQGHQVEVGPALYSDAMGTPGTPEGNYIGMFRHNIKAISEALK